jgi:putative ABC transport system substrate-binding protein
VADPVASGIVARLDRPSGNIIGFANFEPTLGGKWLELLSEIVPDLKRAAISPTKWRRNLRATTWVPSLGW